MLSWFSDRFTQLMNPDQLARVYRGSSPRFSRAVALSHFRHTVQWAGAHSPFYIEKFKELSIDPNAIKTPSDLGDFFTTPDDLVNRAADFICRPPSIVFESSGTSGKNKRVYYGDDELRDMGKSMAAGFRMMGIAPDDRVANAFDFSIWIPGLITHYGLMQAGNFCLAFGKVDPVEVYRRMDLHKFTVVIGEPTWLIRLTELNERDGCPHKLKLLVGGAEEMPANAIPWMKEVWHGAEVRMCYGSVEQGSAIGFQPCTQSGGYHLDTLDFLPELVDVREEGWGELVFSTLRRTVMPLIRYRTRDVTRLDATPCACGIRAPRMAKLRGRRDELVVASGGNLYPLMFENILKPIVGLTHDWQVVFTLEGVREVLSIHVETLRPDTNTLTDEIFAQATDQYPDLMKNLGLGIFQMRVVMHAPGEVRTARKLKRMVDRRHFDATPQTAAEPDLAVVSAGVGGVE